jgi:hypothetical protein
MISPADRHDILLSLLVLDDAAILDLNDKELNTLSATLGAKPPSTNKAQFVMDKRGETLARYASEVDEIRAQKAQKDNLILVRNMAQQTQRTRDLRDAALRKRPLMSPKLGEEQARSRSPSESSFSSKLSLSPKHSSGLGADEDKQDLDSQGFHQSKQEQDETDDDAYIDQLLANMDDHNPITFERNESERYVLGPTAKTEWETPFNDKPMKRTARRLITRLFKAPQIPKKPMDAGIEPALIKSKQWRKLYFDIIPALERLNVDVLWALTFLLDQTERGIEVATAINGMKQIISLVRDNIASSARYRRVSMASILQVKELASDEPDPNTPVLFTRSKLEEALTQRDLMSEVGSGKRPHASRYSSNNPNYPGTTKRVKSSWRDDRDRRSATTSSHNNNNNKPSWGRSQPPSNPTGTTTSNNNNTNSSKSSNPNENTFKHIPVKGWGNKNTSTRRHRNGE